MQERDVITVFIADDHPIIRKGLADLIEADPQLRLVGEAGDGAVAMERIAALHPRVAVLDIYMSGQSGLDVAREIAQRKLPVAVIILTMHDDDEIVSRALEFGVGGYILKDCAADEITRGIHVVAQGGMFISPTIGGRRLQNHGRTGIAGEDVLGISLLTPAERRILRMIADGKKTEQIALELFISVKTVENHRSHICEKLKLNGRNALVHFAITNIASL